MKKKILFGALILILLAVLLPFTSQSEAPEQQKQISNLERKVFEPTQKGKKKTKEERAAFSEARLMHEYYRQVNPITGKISKRDKADEFQNARLAQTKAMQRSSNAIETSFINRGPTNLGGRTRSLAIDKSDPSGNTMLAGAVSGGVFRTTNGGVSWVKVSSNDEIHNVTTIVQDPRNGFENIWYYGTGEGRGNSASLDGVFFLGQGIWKSMDGGLNWSQMPSTASNQDEVDSFFDLIVRLAIHPVTGDLYAAALSRLLRFDGATWFTEIQNTATGIWTDEETDIVFTVNGRAYAAFSGGNENVKGIWTSSNGVGNWTLINTGFFEPAGRVVLALAPSNQNKLYTLFVNGDTGGCAGGVPTQEADLWLWDESNQTYSDYTNVLPFEGGCLEFTDPFYAQGGYDLCVAVKPDNENFVIIGGTNAYKKENITDNSSRFSRIGGYFSDSQYGYYNAGTGVDHHPDIQYLVFSQQNTNVLFSATDGGVHRTDDVTAPTVGWQNLNNNYQTYQFYHVGIDPLNDSDIVIGGAQDNGTNVGGTGFGLPDLTTQLLVSGGDGVAAALSRDQGCYGFVGSQLGPIIRGACDLSSSDVITPNGSASQFVTYFYLDPDNNNALYYAGQNTLYRTANATTVTSSTWDNLGTTALLGTNDYFQTFSTTPGVYNPVSSFLLMGGDEGKIFKLLDPQNATSLSASIDITPPTATLGFPSIVTGLAIHPTNPNIVLATYANYGTESIFLSTDATNATPTWALVEQNLSAHSIRSAAITEVDGETLYFVGTARGLYSSSDPTTDEWVREAPDQIGFALVSSLAYRPSDNHLLIGTHGNGMYEVILTPSLSVNEFDDISDTITLYPNPVESVLNIKVSGAHYNISYKIVNLLGQHIMNGDFNRDVIDVSNLTPGMYIIEVIGDSTKGTKRFIKK